MNMRTKPLQLTPEDALRPACASHAIGPAWLSSDG